MTRLRNERIVILKLSLFPRRFAEDKISISLVSGAVSVKSANSSSTSFVTNRSKGQFFNVASNLDFQILDHTVTRTVDAFGRKNEPILEPNSQHKSQLQISKAAGSAGRRQV